MSFESNKALHRLFLHTIFNEGKLEKLDDLLTPSYHNHDAPPGIPPGKDGLRQIVTMFRAAFPDLAITVEDQIAEEDRVCTRTTTRGTHQGALFGISATGRTITMTGLTMVRVVDSRLAESWVKNDVAGLLRQLGIGTVAR